MRKLMIAGLAGFALVATGPAAAKKKPELTPMELQSLQSHEYETSKEVLFASVVSVFQNMGYQLRNADMPSGFITAASPTKNKTGFMDVLAKQTSSGNSEVTAFVETMSSGRSRVRLNFMNSKTSSSMWGHNDKQDSAVLDPQTYKVAWDKIDEAIFERKAMDAPAKPGTPVTSTASPAAISVPVTAGTSVSVTPTPAAKAPSGK